MGGTMTIHIIVRFQFEGIHSWPGAPQDVHEAYLVYPHRHIFWVEATKRVDHEERAIEFIALKREMLAYAVDWGVDGPHWMSCETMARIFLERFELQSCQVLEDGECGALVKRDGY